jgi:hypothetical protein
VLQTAGPQDLTVSETDPFSNVSGSVTVEVTASPRT